MMIRAIIAVIMRAIVRAITKVVRRDTRFYQGYFNGSSYHAHGTRVLI